MKAVVLALVADTAPVAFGGIAIPITTLAQVTGLPKHDLSQMIGRQMTPLALLVPFVLVYMVDGRRGLREAGPRHSWPAGCSPSFSSPPPTSSPLSSRISLPRSPRPPHWSRCCARGRPVPTRAAPYASRGRARPAIAGAAQADAALERRLAADEGRPLSTRAMLRAFAPYMIIIVVLGVCSLHARRRCSWTRRPTSVALAGPARGGCQRASRHRARSSSSTG